MLWLLTLCTLLVKTLSCLSPWLLRSRRVYHELHTLHSSHKATGNQGAPEGSTNNWKGVSSLLRIKYYHQQQPRQPSPHTCFDIQRVLPCLLCAWDLFPQQPLWLREATTPAECKQESYLYMRIMMPTCMCKALFEVFYWVPRFYYAFHHLVLTQSWSCFIVVINSEVEVCYVLVSRQHTCLFLPVFHTL